MSSLNSSVNTAVAQAAPAALPEGSGNALEPVVAARVMWRSLEEAAGDPAFEQYLHREFPHQIAVWDDPLARRQFLKLMAASLAFAGVVGCTRSPSEKIVPPIQSVDNAAVGRPQYFATALAHYGYGLGVLVESHHGRPTKIEGNPDHPVTLGATDAFLQAAILALYDPDRSQTIRHRGVVNTWETFVESIREKLPEWKQSRGKRLCILTETVTSPTVAAQLASLLKDYPEARWYSHEPVGIQNVYAGARLAFGREVAPSYLLQEAQVILALDCDFLGSLPASLKYARDFIDGRRMVHQAQKMNRLYVAEAMPSITGASADHRIALRPSQIRSLAVILYERLQPRTETSPTDSVELENAGITAAWLDAVVEDLKAHRGSSLVVAGPSQPPEVHILVHALNETLGNVGKTVVYREVAEYQAPHEARTLTDLWDELNRGAVESLLILGGNPAYSSPGAWNIGAKLAEVPFSVHLSEYFDETSAVCSWHIPAAHPLESWGDIRAYDGKASVIQPLIAPLYAGKTPSEILETLTGGLARTSYEMLQSYWKAVLSSQDFDHLWRHAVHQGIIPETQAKTVDVSVNESVVREQLTPRMAAVQTAQPESNAKDALRVEVEFKPDPSVWDGRFANNGWLQELPKPLTKLCWDNVACLSPATCLQYGLENGNVIEIQVERRTILAPVWILPGHPDDCVSLTFGYGRTHSGRVGTGVGYNAFDIRPEPGSWFAQGLIRRTAKRHVLATTQQHHSMEGRDIVRVATLHQLQNGMTGWPEKELSLPTLYPERSPAHETPGSTTTVPNAWGMVIDQTACIGCNACVTACQAENNIPVVGKEQVLLSREMHWLRIDRYYEGDSAQPQTHFQPMMCVHCENAPCEVVCPVAATVHDSEGTNNMVYNRCVGTRYCSNNCPYKVRRFNYLQFSDDSTLSLKLARNPEVTVRSRGVMEKCSYCIQRISAARIHAKIENGGVIEDGSLQTACQQACPTRAITFGNLNDPQSKVQQFKKSELNYGVLAELNTAPRTTYLARVTNPNPALDAVNPASTRMAVTPEGGQHESP